MTGRRALVLGGTAFVGRHLVEALLAEGWDVTLFNRGRTNPGLYEGAVTRLVGDRDHDVSALVDSTWDVVFDVSAYLPRQVEATAQVLASSCDHYVFVSTISVYAALPDPGMNEDSELARWDGPVPQAVTGETYGPLKVLCEERVAQAYPQHTIVRPTIVAGPDDPTDRFTYWPVRLSEPGPHVVPANLDAPVQYVDVRDLANFLVNLGSARTAGTFNAAATPVTFGRLLEAVAHAVGQPLDLVEILPETLAAQGVRPWVDLPLWLNPEDVERRGMLQVSTDRSVAAGLSNRPLDETVRDTFAWALTRKAQAGPALKAGLTHELEAALIAGHDRPS